MPMSLKGAFAKVQHAGGQFYLKVAQFFEENLLIRDAWTSMSQDMEQQAASLEGLHPRFWKVLKSEEEALLNAVRGCPQGQPTDNKEERSLHSCFVRSLDFEEPLILRAYVPLIRLLRNEPSNRALDFYIIVKSHVTRISRIIQSFSVDPALLQRAQKLQQQFEFEVQSPAVPELPAHNERSRQRKDLPSHEFAARKSLRAKASARRTKRALPLSERVQRIAKRAKPMVRKMEIARRRARR